MSSPKKSSSSSHKKSHSGGSSRRENRNSDSGFGSLRDHESVMANPDRNFTAEDYSTQSHSVPALQEALASSNREVEYWKAKYQQANAEVAAKSKELREQKGQWQAMVDRTEVLEDRNAQLETDNKRLRHENDVLREELKVLRQRRTTPPLDSPPPMMTGVGREPAYPPPPIGLAREQIPTRTMSKKSSSKEAAKEKEDKERTKDRLSKRFDREEAPAPPSTSSRDGRYVEGWGPGGRPRRASSVAPSSHRASISSFPVNANYTTTAEPVFSSPRTPTFSAVPRNYTADERYDFREDGSYNAWPLPEQPRHGHRGRRP